MNNDSDQSHTVSEYNKVGVVQKHCQPLFLLIFYCLHIISITVWYYDMVLR